MESRRVFFVAQMGCVGQNNLTDFGLGEKVYDIIWIYLPPSNSHHQEYYILNRESL